MFLIRYSGALQSKAATCQRKLSVAVVIAAFLSLPAFAGKDRIFRHWSAKLEGGWQAALQLHPKAADGMQGGALFWLTDQRDIQWREEANSIIVILKRPWGQDAAAAPELVFHKHEDGLRLAKDGLSEMEAKSLVDIVWQSGGSEPGALASFHDDDSPYSRSHEAGDFILDVSTVPAPLARCAIRIFHDDTTRMIPWIAHPKLPEELFTSLLGETNQPIAPNDKAAESRIDSIHHMMAANPNLPRADLEELWNRPTRQVWGAGLKLRIATHPKADPAWYRRLYEELDSDEESASELRSGLAKVEPMPADLLELLVRRASDSDASTLAWRNDLRAHQIEALIKNHPWSVYPNLIRNNSLPEERYKDALAIGWQDVLQEIMEQGEAPPDAIAKVLEMRVSDPKFHGRNEARDALEAAVGDPRLPAKFHPLHIAHPAPQIRVALAGNPSLSSALLKVLAADAFAPVAKTAREQLAQRKEEGIETFLAGLPPLDSLNPAASENEEIRASLKADDPERFEVMRNLFESLPGYGLAHNAVEAGAIRCLRDQAARGNWSRKSLAYYAAGEGWTADMTALVFSGPMDADLIDTYAYSVVQNGYAGDFDVLAERGLSLRASKQPIVWYAVARRDIQLLKRTVELQAPLDIRYDGMTPAQLAVKMRFMDAAPLLPLEEGAKREIAAFREKFPGDPKAPWLGAWTNGKNEFKTLVLHFNADGTGAYITATGIGAMTAWRRTGGTDNRGEIQIFDDKGREIEGQSLGFVWKNETLEVTLPDGRETFKRAVADER